jgi:hypothetical protein
VSIDAARRLRDATNKLAGPDAAKRRTWTISPCDCQGMTR